jgi:hypothetical protein
VTVTVAGDQNVEISTYTRMPGDETGRAAVIARIGPTLTYCYSREDVLMRRDAWHAALGRARAVFPAAATAGERFTDGVAAQVLAQPQDTCTVMAYAAAAAPDGRAVVFVRTGALTVACLDVIAVVSLYDGWQRADLSAAVLWLSHRPIPPTAR